MSRPAQPSGPAPGAGVWRAGEHYWRAARAGRAALLVDGADYYTAFRAAVAGAERSVLIVGWDIDSQVSLIRPGQHDPAPLYPTGLRDFLDAVVRARPRLHIYVLIWDFAMIYALERESLPIYQFDWRTHRRVHFCLDDRHPFGASHHQKIVVVDDRLAFAGGLDLTRCRWDTREHLANDARRVDRGMRYAPFHDMMLMVDGDAAAALGDLARQRWRQATGRRLRPPSAAPGKAELWPAQTDARFRDCPLAIARTVPARRNRPAVLEVRQQLLAAIAAARRYIYIENQYLTSTVIGDALAARLAEPDGPEVVIVLPQKTSGWLEQATMDVLRARLLRRLVQTDSGRLRLFCPVAPDLGDDCIIVHSKLLIVDDDLLVVGSANLSNRSMGFDSECNLALAADGRDDLRAAIAGVRHDLLAEHLGVSAERVAEAQARHGASLIGAIAGLVAPTGAGTPLGDGPVNRRTLLTLDGSVPEALDSALPDARLIDPERTLSLELFAQELLPSLSSSLLSPASLLSTSPLATAGTDTGPDTSSGGNAAARAGSSGGIGAIGRVGAVRDRRRGYRSLVLAGVTLAVLVAVWQFTPLGDWLTGERLRRWLQLAGEHPLAPLWVLLSFLAASLVAFPITALIVVTALVFGPLLGFVYAAAGTMAGAALGYLVGRRLGRGAVRRLAGPRINQVSRILTRQGLMTMAVVRTVPVAPFTVVNLVAGASQLRFRDYLLGTALGMGPGMLMLTVFADGVARTVREPSLHSVGIAALTVVGVAAGAWLLQRWLRRQGDYDEGPMSGGPSPARSPDT